jgi:hypothetical protein
MATIKVRLVLAVSTGVVTPPAVYGRGGVRQPVSGSRAPASGFRLAGLRRMSSCL